jgi:hypothetical protein
MVAQNCDTVVLTCPPKMVKFMLYKFLYKNKYRAIFPICCGLNVALKVS